MKIKLKKAVYGWPAGAVLNVMSVVSHGGYTDEARQFEVDGQLFVLDSYAEIVGEGAR